MSIPAVLCLLNKRIIELRPFGRVEDRLPHTCKLAFLLGSCELVLLELLLGSVAFLLLSECFFPSLLFVFLFGEDAKGAAPL